MNSRTKSNTPATRARIEAPADSVAIRHCHGLEEFEACIRVEREVWKSSDIDIVPLPIFVVASETGGQVLGAFEGADLVGFTLAVAGWKNGKPFLHSHMTAVSDSHRDRGIGRRLKLFQRKDAVARAIRLVEWTFDPLMAKNAYFNLMRLGAIARRYLPNAYGITTSPLHGSIHTDRLVAEWHLSSPRVRRTLAAKEKAAPISKKVARIEIPSDLEELRATRPEQVLEIQSRLRGEFKHWFDKGYAATAIAPGKVGMEYLLEPWSKA